MSGFFAVIPATVLDDEDLNANEMLLYADISALCNRRGYCWARNSYFAERRRCTERSIRNWVSHLEERGHIKVEARGPNRRIFLSNDALERHTAEAHERAMKTSVNEFVDDNVDPYDEVTRKKQPVSEEPKATESEEDFRFGKEDSKVLERGFHHISTVNSTDIQTESNIRSSAPVSTFADAKEVGKMVLKQMTAVFPITKDEYPLHAKKARQIADRVCEMAPDAPNAAAGVVLAAFRDLVEHGDGFWRKQPYTAPTLASAGIWSRVVAYIRETHASYSGRDAPGTPGEWESFAEDIWA